jgi:surface carbohydrate biosynthesis protein (TIGR04326 family)
LTITSRELLVWDGEGAPPQEPEALVLWRGFGTPDGTELSIPRHLEARAEVLRARYLAWIHELGETEVAGRRLLDHFQLRPDFSFWWLTLISEKSNAFNSPQIIGVLKLLALEDLIGHEWRGKVVLASADASLARAFGNWCRNEGRYFEWRPLERARLSQGFMRRVNAVLPARLQALIRFVRLVRERLPLRGAGTAELARSAGRITFCSYLFNLDKAAAKEGRFATSFWTALHAMLDRVSGGVNWLLVYIGHDFVPTTQDARRLVDRFNGRPEAHVHAPLDGALSWRVISRTLRDYLSIAATARRLRHIPQSFRLPDSGVDLWPLMERDWEDSLRGRSAITNCLMLNLIEDVVARLPPQRIGFYLQENIAWELALVHFWHASGHGRLIGVPHSTIRFWDLRYFFDPRSLVRRGRNDLPLPDLVAVNGPAARSALCESGFPPDRLVEVEALRYLHLSKFSGPAAAPADAQRPLRVLVLGDYVRSVTQQQMRWLVAAAASLPADTRYVVKPHPACPVSQSDYPSLRLQLTNLSLDKLLVDCDVAYTSNMTSAAVDAFSSGVPVVSVLDAEAFNISPLRGVGGVSYVTNPAELASSLLEAHGKKSATPPDYFRLDRELPRWQELLGLKESA